MKKILLIILISFMWLNPLWCFAEDANQEEGLADMMEFRNPFTPQLPKKEITNAEITPPVIAKTQETPEINVSGEIAPPQLSIAGLVWDTDRPQAIVNSRVVGIGDTIDNSVITNIKKTGIDVLYQGKHFTINVNPQTTQSQKPS